MGFFLPPSLLPPPPFRCFRSSLSPRFHRGLTFGLSFSRCFFRFSRGDCHLPCSLLCPKNQGQLVVRLLSKRETRAEHLAFLPSSPLPFLPPFDGRPSTLLLLVHSLSVSLRDRALSRPTSTSSQCTELERFRSRSARVLSSPPLRPELVSSCYYTFRESSVLTLLSSSSFPQHVVTFNMDEYVGIPRDHPQSYHTFMFENCSFFFPPSLDPPQLPLSHLALFPDLLPSPDLSFLIALLLYHLRISLSLVLSRQQSSSTSTSLQLPSTSSTVPSLISSPSAGGTRRRSSRSEESSSSLEESERMVISLSTSLVSFSYFRLSFEKTIARA